jgi:inner membrane protein
MDPVTQGVFGSLFAQASAKKKHLAKALVIGAIAGMMPDLDVLIHSEADPLLNLQYHRHFTHSILFIPIIGFLASLVLHPTLGKLFKLKFSQTLLWCVLGVTSHGLVDALTSYGTLLYWPFSSERVAWDTVSIIDPLLTVPLIVFITLAAVKKKRHFNVIAIVWAISYLSVAHFQHHRAIEQGKILAQTRGLDIINVEAKPSFANILIWKIITTTEDRFYIDAVKVGWKDNIIWQGDSIQKLSIDRDFSWLDKTSQQYKDIERFLWFSQGYVAQDGINPNRIMDVRYSMLPHTIKPLWGIELSKQAQTHDNVAFYSEHNDSKDSFKTLWGMLWE